MFAFEPDLKVVHITKYLLGGGGGGGCGGFFFLFFFFIIFFFTCAKILRINYYQI
jgi:hypothetical protein